MVREYDYRSGGWGFISPKVLLDESFQLNIQLMSSSGIHKDNYILREIQQGPGGLVDMHGSPDPSASNLAGGSVPHACFLACKTC